ncbi:MAG TPA: alpha-L-arabinofuranosidase C-terminal domain-containing protein [Acidobacteriota bacterium]|nr:alpha-L-arabinofuranosidase C-terminal domain-containing protein [Acidobacteriota bacterium]
MNLTRRDFVHNVGKLSLGLASCRIGRAGYRSIASPQPAAEPLKARLKIDPDRRLGSIDPGLYGNFVEHLGRCIYGGIYEEGSGLSDPEGIRKDVLDAARKLRVTQLRWPGGNFVSGYHWQEGIGAKDSRPARYDLAWFERESNRFGTDEFVSFCRKLGAEPYICVNAGNGTLDEAMHWVEYCNHEGGTYFSDLRKKNGHEQPYRVKYWGIGNEIYGEWQIGHKNAQDYAKAAVEFAKVIKWMDPDVKLIACGSGDPAWDRPVLEMLVKYVDYISAHHYTVIDELKEYYEIVGSVAQMEATMRTSAATGRSVSAAARKSPPVLTAFDEWNIINNWSDGGKRDDVHKFEISYNLRDALWVGAALNALQRNCDSVRLANLAQLVNVIAPIYATPAGILLRTTYFPLELYANRSGRIALDVLNLSPLFETRNFGGQKYLDISATYDEEKRRVSLAVVNRRKEGDVVGTVELQGVRAKTGGRAFVITGPSPESENTLENPKAVSTLEAKFSASGEKCEYVFRRHSITWLEFDLEA